MCKKLFPLIFVLVLLLAAGVQARIIYVDATDGETGNTRLVTGEVLVAPDPGNNGSGDDGLWRKRAFGNGPSIFESCGDYRNAPYDTEDCPRLVTSVDVPIGYYEVFVYFWDTNSSWRLRASLENSEGQLPLFLPNDPNGLATKADVNDFDAPVPLVTTSGNRIMWQVPLGRTGLTTKIAVYADDDPNTRDSNKRTWYDGIGYKALPPQIIYVDASEGEAGNTKLASGEVFKSVPDNNGSDNIWRGRAFGNSATIFESGGTYGETANPENCPRLVTSVDVPEFNYNVYVYFWSDTTANGWRMQASLTNIEDPALFIANDPNGGATVADVNDFAKPVPLMIEGNRTLWQAYLGTTGITTTINVYIDDDPNHQSHNRRTWYDGIGYKVVVPKIVYVDATEGETGNTRLTTGEVLVAPDPGNNGSGDDGLWRKRAFGNGPSIFESCGDYRNAPYDTEDCPRLVTTVDVPENIYDVFAYFWDTNSSWRLRASLTNSEGQLPLFLPNDPNGLATKADANDFAAPVPLVTTSGNRIMWQAPLGRTGLTTKIAVYADDDPNTRDSNKRTWYDGIGYKLVSGLEVEPEVIVPPPPPPPPPPVVLPNPVDPCTTGLVAHYAFENNTNDSSVNGLNGTIVGNPTYAAGLTGYGTAMSFDGNGDYIDCGNNPAFDITGQITVAAWVNITSIPTQWAAIVVKGENAWRLSSYAGARSFHFGICYWDKANYSANGQTEVPLNEWHHVCGTYDGATIKLYLDAVVDASTASTTGIDISTTNLWIGANSEYAEPRYWDGLIDEVTIFNRALSQAEVVYLAKK